LAKRATPTCSTESASFDSSRIESLSPQPFQIYEIIYTQNRISKKKEGPELSGKLEELREDGLGGRLV